MSAFSATLVDVSKSRRGRRRVEQQASKQASKPSLGGQYSRSKRRTDAGTTRAAFRRVVRVAAWDKGVLPRSRRALHESIFGENNGRDQFRCALHESIVSEKHVLDRFPRAAKHAVTLVSTLKLLSAHDQNTAQISCVLLLPLRRPSSLYSIVMSRHVDKTMTP